MGGMVLSNTDLLHLDSGDTINQLTLTKVYLLVLFEFASSPNVDLLSDIPNQRSFLKYLELSTNHFAPAYTFKFYFSRRMMHDSYVAMPL
jgi:hypothetical protein